MENEPNKEILKESSFEYYFDQEREVSLFYQWLFNGSKNHLDFIYRAFPELTDIHKNTERLSETEIMSKIKDVLLAFREKYADNIKQVEENITAKLPGISEGVKSLETYMQETEHFKYLVMPSIYPICPFDIEKQLFYFTITSVKDGKTEPQRLSSVSLHEISHFIFFRQIKSIENTLSKVGIHHLKEVLTPVILQNSDVLKHRDEKYICGNSESVDYQIQIDGRVMSIFDYVNQKYQENPTPEGYIPFLHWLIAIFEQIEPEVIKRDELFAKNGRAVFTDAGLNKQFMEPIVLKS